MPRWDKKLIKQLRDRGLRATAQRLAIIDALREDKTHPSAEQLYEKLKSQHPTISLSTVYKTLQVLVEFGILQTIDTGCGRQRFDGDASPHHHAVCRRCHRVFDIPAEACPIPLANRDLLPNFHIESAQLYFSGLCQKCMNNPPKDTDARDLKGP